MCSVGDDMFESGSNKIMTKDEKIVTDTCNKCKMGKPCVVLRHKDTYCKSCFLAGSTHKFKAVLGKSKLIRPNDKILVYYKIGHPSTALLHFLRTGLDLNTPKKFRFDLIVLFLEDEFELSVEERQDILRKVKKEVVSLGFKLYFASFVQYILNPKELCDVIKYSDLDISQNDKETVWNMLDKKISKTNINEIIHLFKRRLLVDAAKWLNCNFIFTPEISIDTASHLLTNISLGRGYHVAIDTGFCDDRDDVKILRPLRLFDVKELAFYNKFNKLEPVAIRQQHINQYASVHDLMKKFVKDLQENYPATIATVIRTGDKLSLDKNEKYTCKLCKGILLEKNSELTSEESTSFSRLVSTSCPDSTLSGQERYQDILDKFETNSTNDDRYCYACTKILPYVIL